MSEENAIANMGCGGGPQFDFDKCTRDDAAAEVANGVGVVRPAARRRRRSLFIRRLFITRELGSKHQYVDVNGEYRGPDNQVLMRMGSALYHRFRCGIRIGPEQADDSDRTGGGAHE